VAALLSFFTTPYIDVHTGAYAKILLQPSQNINLFRKLNSKIAYILGSTCHHRVLTYFLGSYMEFRQEVNKGIYADSI
jgi:hypothetical protein